MSKFEGLSISKEQLVVFQNGFATEIIPMLLNLPPQNWITYHCNDIIDDLQILRNVSNNHVYIRTLAKTKSGTATTIEEIREYFNPDTLNYASITFTRNKKNYREGFVQLEAGRINHFSTDIDTPHNTSQLIRYVYHYETEDPDAIAFFSIPALLNDENLQRIDISDTLKAEALLTSLF